MAIEKLTIEREAELFGAVRVSIHSHVDKLINKGVEDLSVNDLLDLVYEDKIGKTDYETFMVGATAAYLVKQITDQLKKI